MHGTPIANINCMKLVRPLVVCSIVSGGSILIVGLGMGIAYLLFVLTGAIV
jgi:hypothetical protein